MGWPGAGLPHRSQPPPRAREISPPGPCLVFHENNAVSTSLEQIPIPVAPGGHWVCVTPMTQGKAEGPAVGQAGLGPGVREALAGLELACLYVSRRGFLIDDRGRTFALLLYPPWGTLPSEMSTPRTLPLRQDTQPRDLGHAVSPLASLTGLGGEAPRAMPSPWEGPTPLLPLHYKPRLLPQTYF